MKDLSFYSGSIGFSVPTGYYDGDDADCQIYTNDLERLLDVVAMMVACCAPKDAPTKHDGAARMLASVADYIRHNGDDFQGSAGCATDYAFAKQLMEQVEDRDRWERRMINANIPRSQELWRARQTRINELEAYRDKDEPLATATFRIRKKGRKRTIGSVKFYDPNCTLNYQVYIVTDKGKDPLGEDGLYPHAETAIRAWVDWETEAKEKEKRNETI